MSFFDKSHGFVISGSQFTSNSITNLNKHDSRKKGIDLLYEHTAPGAFHNSAERYDPPKCHPNTRVAVIQAIVDWVEDGHKKTLIKWMYGAAGAGKSAIAQEIAERYHKSGRLAASFFWSRNAAGRNDETRLIPSLVYQLLIAIPQIRNHVEEAVETDPSIFTRSMEAQMESLVIGPLEKAFLHGQEISSELPNLIILDGLDECGTPQAQQYILRVIANSVRKFPIPLFFLIASRPEHVIRTSFHINPLLDMTASLILDERYHPDDDIRLFLVASFESVTSTHHLRSLLPHVWPTKSDINHLIRKSSGQFVYASTVVKFVSTSRRQPDKRLDIIMGITAAEKDAPFAELDALYHHIFSSVEDWPSVFDILASLFLLIEWQRGTFEIILSFRPGELQLILIDLHSVLEVPGPENQLTEPRILHASLQDFLLDPSRSRNFAIDEPKAHARIAQRVLRYIKHCPHHGVDDDLSVEVAYSVFSSLEHHCSYSLPTRELFDDFSGFDFLKWALFLLNNTPVWEFYMLYYFQIIRLYDWLQGLEANVQGYFCLEHSSFRHHFYSRELALDLLYIKFCDGLSTDKDIIATAMTHPQILYHYNQVGSYLRLYHFNQVEFQSRSGGVAFDEVLNCGRDLDHCLLSADNRGKEPVELQKYLRRAGKSFVHGGTYTKLSAKILDFILETCERTRYQQAEYNHGTLEGNDIRLAVDDYGFVSFAINILPFYLSNANYEPELARRASNLLDLTFRNVQDIDDSPIEANLKEFHQAIDLYLKTRPPTPEAEIEWRLKRYRNNEEIIERTGLALPMIPPPPKRLRLMDLLNPAMGPRPDI